MTAADEPKRLNDRLRRVEALYHEMLARPAHERAAAIVAACPGDPSLAAEVQSLLDQPESAVGFLAAPAMEVAAGLVSKIDSPLTGKRVGVFELQELLGVGGMGEVYRAHDTKLGRDVAIKVLPAAVASDPERMARFRREARVLAALNHPNIAAIYGLEEAAGQMFLVMELVDGEDLAERLRRGAIPVDQAIALARQMAEGLEDAHEKGIVHRDLKPANIKVTTDGRVKVLDFGLARAYALEPTAFAEREIHDSPTQTRLTQAGLSLGTPGYMAPEQVRGAAVDKRADIWAFGVVLFEMLTGVWLFKGNTPGDALAAVLRHEPEWSSLPAATPASIRALLGRCLERDLKLRLRDIGEARIALTAPASSKAANNARRALPWVVVITVTLVGLWAALSGQRPPVPAPSPPKKLLVTLGADASLATGWGPSAILSPDGSTLAFLAEQGDRTRLFVRGLDQLQATALPGTEDATHPFFSPDGKWIAFFGQEKLKKVPTVGGAVVTLCDARRGRGGDWGDDGMVVFAPDINVPLHRVSAEGGTPVPLGTDGDEGGTHRWPQVLPGGRGILFTRDVAQTAEQFEKGEIVVASLKTGPSGQGGAVSDGRAVTPKVVVRRAYYGRYVPSGHLVYVQKDRLFAARFDLDRMEVIGQGVPILDLVGANVGSGGAQISFSSEGTLVYLPESFLPAPIDWVTRDGPTTALYAKESIWANPRFSPDGARLAVDISDGKQRDIFIYEVERGLLTPLTLDPDNDSDPVWSPDGKRIAFSSDRGQAGALNLYWMNADGTNTAQRLTRSLQDEIASSWHPSGRWLAFWARSKTSKGDLKIVPVEEGQGSALAAGQPFDVLSSTAGEARPAFSPDGRWLAYTSDESGVSEVYVRPFPGPGGTWRVSRGSGWFPRWSPREPRLLFIDLNRARVMYVDYRGQTQQFRPGEPATWSPTVFRGAGSSYAYDIHPDGRRVAARVDRKRRDKVVFFFGFFDYLKKILPEGRGNPS